MDRSKIIIVLIGVILTALMIIGYIMMPENWGVTYNYKSDDPYALELMKDLVKNHGNKHGSFRLINSRRKEFLKEDDQNATYIFIGSQFYDDSAQTAELMQFMERGNSVFIACNYGPYSLADTLLQLPYDTSLTLDADNFMAYDVNIKFKDFEKKAFMRNMYDTIEYTWFKSNIVDTLEQLENLGYINEEPNFIKIKHGKGNLYIHTNPELFTNYFVNQEAYLQYYNLIFKELGYQNYIWDESSRFYYQDFNSPQVQHSPLKTFLKIENFRWAWYTLLGLFVTILIFGSKRKQRIIPIIKAKQNTSKEFISTIGSLYFQSQDHAHLGKLKLKLFNHYLYERYGLRLEEENVKKLSISSGVKESLINELITKQKAIMHLETISSDYLIGLHAAIEKFKENGK